MRGVTRIHVFVLVLSLVFAPGMAAAAPTCDKDGDGFDSTSGACGGTDCNDNDFTINPSAAELCDGIDNDCDGSADNVAACDPVIDLQERVAALETLLAVVSQVTHNGQRTLRFEGVNVQIVDGTGSTASNSGVGNLIVGYDEDWPGTPEFPASVKTGTHNLIVGPQHSYTSYGGAVMGARNVITGIFATVTGGTQNVSSESTTSVSGGQDNVASGHVAHVCGGWDNEAGPGHQSNVSGGAHNVASGLRASVSGGRFNTASGGWSSISGGGNANPAEGNTASGEYSSVLGGIANTAAGGSTAIVGGGFNDTVDFFSSVLGGNENTASGRYSTVSGGNNNTASGQDSSISGGAFNTAQTQRSSIAGGDNLVNSTAGAHMAAEGTVTASD